MILKVVVFPIAVALVTPVGSDAAPHVASPLAGMVVTSHDAGQVATAMFSNVGISATPFTTTATTELRLAKVPRSSLDPAHGFLRLEVVE